MGRSTVLPASPQPPNLGRFGRSSSSDDTGKSVVTGAVQTLP